MTAEAFWGGRRVLVTGHTGFKGSWLALLLQRLGAEVTGYALEPPTVPSLFEQARVGEGVKSVIGDVRDGECLADTMGRCTPEVVFHLAAQPLVRESYRNPVETYAVNVLGTVNLLEAARHTESVSAVVNVTTDKCYHNEEWSWGYRECDRLGGHDPYSNSKACSELVTAAYRSSYFDPGVHPGRGVAVASARAGNVIGGGDWAAERLVPDCVRALLEGKPIRVRSPHAVRPWQHVLEPLTGYLLLAQKLLTAGSSYAKAWNFGPEAADARPVEWIVRHLCSHWRGDASFVVDPGPHPHEAQYLRLDCSLATGELGWRPRWNLAKALGSIVAWAEAYRDGADPRQVCLDQIDEFLSSPGED